MRRERYRIRIHVGNLLELCGAGASVYGVARLAGLAFGLILLGILFVVAAELIYDATVLRVPLPRRPHPLDATRRARVRVERWTWDRRVKRLVRGGSQ